MSENSKLDDFLFDLVARTAQPHEGVREGLERLDRYKAALSDLMSDGLNRYPQINQSILGLNEGISG